MNVKIIKIRLICLHNDLFTNAAGLMRDDEGTTI